MRSVNTRDLREHLAEHLDAVQAGERIVVTRRGRPVAELVRVAQTAPSKEVAAALASGIASRAGDIKALRALLHEPPGGEPADLVAQVLADRHE